MTVLQDGMYSAVMMFLVLYSMLNHKGTTCISMIRGIIKLFFELIGNRLFFIWLSPYILGWFPNVPESVARDVITDYEKVEFIYITFSYCFLAVMYSKLFGFIISKLINQVVLVIKKHFKS